MRVCVTAQRIAGEAVQLRRDLNEIVLRAIREVVIFARPNHVHEGQVLEVLERGRLGAVAGV